MYQKRARTTESPYQVNLWRDSPKKRSFVLSWMKIYPWVLVEGDDENMTVYCRQCKKAGLTNEYAVGKKALPRDGRKSIYRGIQKTISMQSLPFQHLKLPRVQILVKCFLLATEVQTLGLLHNIYFLVTNGLPIHSFVDYQLTFYSDDPCALSPSHRTGWSSWELVHESNDISVTKNLMLYTQFVQIHL